MGQTSFSAPLFFAVARLKPQASQAGNGAAPSSPVIRRSSEPQLCQGNGSKSELSDSPHSTPSHGCSRASPSPSASSYSDPDSGHYCQLHPPSPVQWDRPTPDNKVMPTKSYVERLKGDECQRGFVLNGSEGEAGSRKRLEQDMVGFVIPVVERTSSFNPALFHSLLIPGENKPLEMMVLKKIKELLAEGDARTLAKHITHVDCLVRGREESGRVLRLLNRKGGMLRSGPFHSQYNCVRQSAWSPLSRETVRPAHQQKVQFSPRSEKTSGGKKSTRLLERRECTIPVRKKSANLGQIRNSFFFFKESLF